MTMDVRRRLESRGPYPETDPPSSKPATKRSFDVAFLMAPDDSAKKRQQQQEELKEQLRLVAGSALVYPEDESKRIYPPELGLIVGKDEFPKSAFTKVAREPQLSPPGPALSPATDQDSRSPTYYPKYQLPTTKPVYQKSTPEEEKVQKRFPDVVPYGGLAAMTYPFPAVIPPAPPALVTAALLPSSLAALTLPAQNVCAKCNISFRMTSDLVYHMRSQHKSEHGVGESSRRRREQDKLRCPVCNESFRERHHLTRHMTAHQDKDGDRTEEEVEELTARRRLTAK